jgi:hypothetical protein
MGANSNVISDKYIMIMALQLNQVQVVEMLSIFRTDPEVYDDKKQKHLKGSTQKL